MREEIARILRIYCWGSVVVVVFLLIVFGSDAVWRML